jgi:hypothetical protein
MLPLNGPDMQTSKFMLVASLSSCDVMSRALMSRSISPGTRARAVGSLLFFKIMPLWIATRVCTLMGMKERAEKFRVRTGNVFADGLLRLG